MWHPEKFLQIEKSFGGIEPKAAELKTAYAHTVPRFICGRITKRPKMNLSSPGTGWAYAELK